MLKRSEYKKKKGLKKRWVIIPVVVVLTLLLGTGVYGYSLLSKAKDTVNTKMHEPIESIDLTKTKKKVKASEPLNVLLLGVDARGADKGRSDALMVLSLDPQNDAMQIVSIPRDTRTMIAGKGFQDKINHAYAFGGADMSVATVEDFLDIDLDYYVRLNMEGLQELVDEIGPITVQNNIAWKDGKYDFPKGDVTMDGAKTMSYVRMRKQDPAGDFGRTERQRNVIEAIVDTGATAGSVTKIHNMIDILGNNMSTNMDFDDMKKMFSGYKNTRKHMNSYMMQGQGTKIDGIYYMNVADDEIAKVHDMLKR
ncbi:Transcriptional regulator LytR [Lentibacillus sp. JNUCC-1]|uniref:LCP family glycopolymer transferase n=1 Tax=Lentibacillus sp. JNUCC-1 TaxID=2654513 RepID=UPI0013215F15|nr:Transcriptional regulator LytR [Lentibacillus sp. JNUCC-1]